MPVVIDYTDSGTTGILIISPAGYPGSGAPLDLSDYLNVQADAGMDPANPEFTQKVFSHALLKEGGVQALESFQLKEMQFPMYLDATTRDGVTALIQEINNYINAPGQTVLWQDQGVSQPTYYDLASGQFDPEYDFRRAGGYRIAGKLRLFVQPLGHTATMRLVASAAGTGPLLTLPIPSPILGDAAAQLQAQLNTGINWAPFAGASEGHRIAVSVIPPAYTPQFPVPSLAAGYQATQIGASGAVASKLLRWIVPPALTPTQYSCNFTIPTTIAAVGVNRILGVARTSGTAFLQTNIPNNNVGLYGPTTLLTVATSAAAKSWQLVDLGTISIPSSLPYPTSMEVQVYVGAPSSGATVTIDITDVIMLPDSTTVFIDDTGIQAAGASSLFFFDGIQSESWSGQSLGTALYFGQRLSQIQRGAIPKLNPGQPSSQLAIVVLGNSTESAITSKVPANDTVSASINVRDRVRFAF